jgi:hypothetical protein
MFKTLMRWLHRRLGGSVPAYSETLSDEPGVVFEVKSNAVPRDPREPEGYSETYSEPGVVFEVDCRARKERTGTAGN